MDSCLLSQCSLIFFHNSLLRKFISSTNLLYITALMLFSSSFILILVMLRGYHILSFFTVVCSSLDMKKRKEVVRSVLTAYEIIRKKVENKERPLYRTEQWKQIERLKDKRMKKSNWYKKNPRIQSDDKRESTIPSVTGNSLKRYSQSSCEFNMRNWLRQRCLGLSRILILKVTLDLDLFKNLQC